MVESSNVISFCALLVALPPGAVAVRDMVKITRYGEDQMNTNKPPSLILAIASLGAFAAALVLCCWMFFAKPLRSNVIETQKIVTVEKSVPCAPSKSGNATTRGKDSPAVTGSGNSFGPATQSPH